MILTGKTDETNRSTQSGSRQCDRAGPPGPAEAGPVPPGEGVLELDGIDVGSVAGEAE